MSDKNMADDINKAINSGGYVIVPEKAVEGTGRNAIYVYMTYDGRTGYQAWKISGGLNGGSMNSDNSGEGNKLIEALILTMLGVSPANAQTNGDIANTTAQMLIPWYGRILSLLGLYNLFEDMREAGCNSSDTISALGRHALLMFAPLSILFLATGPFSLILLTVFLVFLYTLFIDWVMEVNHSWSVANCKKE